jgi:AraC-like DNA-binding protein
MFSVLDILNLVIISALVVAFAVLYNLDDLINRPRIYLKALLFAVLFVVVNDEIAYSGPTWLTIILTPVNYFALFLIYPVLYLYLREMTFPNGETLNSAPLRFLFFPLIVFFVLLVNFAVLPVEMHEMFIINHLSNDAGDNWYLSLLRLFIITGYYVQTGFFVWKMYTVKRLYLISFGQEFSQSKIVRQSVLFAPVIILYEGVILLAISFFTLSDFEIRVIELSASLMFIFFALYIIFNHSVQLLQLRLEKFHVEISTETSAGQTISGHMPDEEVETIRVLLENYLRNSKIYLDPNLSIESLGKRIHVQSRKISFVINHVYQKNFHAFINEFRIAEAITLLKSDKSSNLEDIYVRVGFNSRSTFNRVFKAVTGQSPSEFLTKG